MARIDLVSIDQVDLLTIFFVLSVPELRLQVELYPLKTGRPESVS